MGGDTVLELAGGGDGARVVDAGGAVEGRDVTTAGLVDAVGKTVAVVGAGGTLADHPVDGVVGARGLDVAVVVAGVVAVVVLHQAGVADAVVGGAHADAAARLLHDDGEDEAMVNTSAAGGLLDAVPDGADLGAAVVGNVHPLARVEHGVLVVVEHVLKRNPLALVGPALAGAAVAPVHGVAVDAVADAILNVVGVVVGNVAVGHLLASLAAVEASHGGRRRLEVSATRGLGEPLGKLDLDVLENLGHAGRVGSGNSSAGEEGGKGGGLAITLEKCAIPSKTRAVGMRLTLKSILKRGWARAE